jgi:hypothetical protein
VIFVGLEPDEALAARDNIQHFNEQEASGGVVDLTVLRNGGVSA